MCLRVHFNTILWDMTPCVSLVDSPYLLTLNLYHYRTKLLRLFLYSAANKSSSCKYCTPYSHSKSWPFQRSLNVALLFLYFPHLSSLVDSRASSCLPPCFLIQDGATFCLSDIKERFCMKEVSGWKRKEGEEAWHVPWTDVIFFFLPRSNLKVFWRVGNLKLPCDFLFAAVKGHRFADLSVFERWPIRTLGSIGESWNRQTQMDELVQRIGRPPLP